LGGTRRIKKGEERRKSQPKSDRGVTPLKNKKERAGTGKFRIPREQKKKKTAAQELVNAKRGGRTRPSKINGVLWDTKRRRVNVPRWTQKRRNIFLGKERNEKLTIRRNWKKRKTEKTEGPETDQEAARARRGRIKMGAQISN